MRGPHRLARPGDVRKVLGHGQRVRARFLDVRMIDRGDALPSRVTVIAGRRVGNAVVRNRAKRRIRSAVREAVPQVGRDVVVIAKRGCDTAPYSQLREAIGKATAFDASATERRTRA